MARQPVNGRVVAAREIAHPRPLDLDDPRPQIGQLPRCKRRSDSLFNRDDGDAGQRE
jgi:hypothetical protein